MSEQPNTQTKPAEGVKTFTQEDVNRIVSSRLTEDREKHGAELAEREKELSHREYTVNAKAHLAGKGLPTELLDIVKASSMEELEGALKVLETHMQKKGQHTLPRAKKSKIPRISSTV